MLFSKCHDVHLKNDICRVSMQEHHSILGLEVRFEAKAGAQALRFVPGFEVMVEAHTIAEVFLYFQNIPL